MPIVLSKAGKLLLLDAITLGTPVSFFAGLFQNDAVMDQDMTLTRLGVANYSGYSGLQGLGAFSSASLDGERAIASSGPLTWTHNGGPIGQWIYGYYAVDSSGELLWANKRTEGPMMMSFFGQEVTVTPAVSLRSEFGG